MWIEQRFKGKDYVVGKWIQQIVQAMYPHQTFQYTETYSADTSQVAITLRYDDTEIKKIVKRAYKIFVEKKK